jgi:hypothetical protein
LRGFWQRSGSGFAANKALTLEVQLARRTPEQAAFLVNTGEAACRSRGVGAACSSFHDNQVAQPTTIKIEGRPSVASEETANLISVTPITFIGYAAAWRSSPYRFDAKNVPVASSAILWHCSGLRKTSWRRFLFCLMNFFTAEIVRVVGDMRTQAGRSGDRRSCVRQFSCCPIR